jgi:two-component system cell cycle response regulator
VKPTLSSLVAILNHGPISADKLPVRINSLSLIEAGLILTQHDDTLTNITAQQPTIVGREEPHFGSLVMIHGSQMGFSFPLDKEEMVIGRSSECDIQIDDANVSRKHAQICNHDNAFQVHDLKSTNGTFVNSRRVTEATLEDGDLLMISSTVLKFVSSASIENHFFDQMYSMLTTDYQTRIYNYRYLVHRLHEEFSRCVRYNRPLSLMIYDIDNFKAINDNFGHPAGDVLLVKSAQLVSSHLRCDDVYARFGGDEFCILCPETTLEQMLHMAERIRSLMSTANFKFKDWKLDVSISIGAAELTDDLKSPDLLLAIADKALYRAKNNGRNQVAY